MNWWYKDIFVDRYINSEIEQRPTPRKRKFRTITTLWAKLKESAESLLRRQHEKHMIRRSHTVLSQLSDHYLSDIGLTPKGLYSISEGNYPVRHQENSIENLNTRDFELVLCENTKSETNSGQDCISPSYKKAA